MDGSFEAETLKLLDETEEVYIETRRDAGAPEHRTVVWAVVVGGMVFARSGRARKGRWYGRSRQTPKALCSWETPASPYAPLPQPTVRRSRRLAKRPGANTRRPGPTAAMVRPDALPMTLKLSPAYSNGQKH